MAYELSITRHIDVPIEAVWRAWTEHLAEWWCPVPWSTEVIENDFRVGGRSAITMHGPAGEEQAMEGVFLEVTPRARIVLTNAFTAGWVPQPPFMVALYDFAAEDGCTRYTATARHWDEATRDQHAAMGFEPGWNAATDQLVAVAARLAG